ncbi:MAG TPA: hypothetical protein VLK29_04040, partial [Luteimonas sp.]|nr:hypothetical protein [Luteimonas sp.]
GRRVLPAGAARRRDTRRRRLTQRTMPRPAPPAATDPRIDLEPPGRRFFVLFFLLMVALPLASVAVSMWVALSSHAPLKLLGGSVAGTWAGALGTVVVLTVPLWWWLSRVLHRHRLSLSTDALLLATGFYRRRVPVASMDLDAARVVDLRERLELRPRKVNATSAPGLRSGWFRVGGGRRVLVAMTNGHRVLWIPTRGEFDLMLQVRQPYALLERLTAMAGMAGPR